MVKGQMLLWCRGMAGIKATAGMWLSEAGVPK